MFCRSLVTLSLFALAAFEPGAYAQAISHGGVVNAASFQAPVAPGSVISIFGTNLASSAVAASSVPLPSALGGTSVRVNGELAPLFYASPLQINAQLPFDTPPGAVTLTVTANGSTSAPEPFTVAAAAPGILVYGQGRAVALNQDYSLNGSGKPALAGSVITVYMTGQGPVTVPVASGAVSPADPLALPSLPVTAAIGGQPADVVWAGLSPGSVGLFQVNLRIPHLASGDAPLIVTVGGAASNPALLAVSAPDGTPPGLSIVRTMAFHQLTSLPDNGPDLRSSTALSGNGKVIAYTYNGSPNLIYVMNFDGTGQRQVDSYAGQCFCPAIVDISDDGSVVVSTEERQVRIVDSNGALGLITVDTGVAGLRIEGDGGRVFFLLDRDGNFLGDGGSSSPAQRGLYVINADGSGLRQIVGPDAVAGLFGTTVNDQISPAFTNTGNAPNHTLGVTFDGAHIVFAAQQIAGNSPEAIFGVDLDGNGLHFVIEPVAYVQHLGISSDGSKVLYDTTSASFVDEVGVVNFDGTGQLALSQNGLQGNPAQLSADGSLLVAYDMLYNTDGSGVLQLSTLGNSLSPGVPVMNGDATRFVYSFVYPGTYSQGLSQLATIEMYPATLGAAPAISSPAINPGYVIPDDVFTATATMAAIPFQGVWAGYGIVRDGLVEPPVTGDIGLMDDGTSGDQVAGDGIFTSNIVQGTYQSPTGPRLLRLFAEVKDGAGKLHAMIVDTAPFFVVSQPPAGPAPHLDSVSPTAGAGGTVIAISGSGFDPQSGNNQVIVGSRLARVVSASPTQLQVQLPGGLPAGLASVIVGTQGQTSNSTSFTVR